MKKRVLFVISRLAVGGAQKSMIKALSIIDYTKYDVTLYVRERRKELLPDVPREVNVIFNDDRDYNHRFVPLVYEIVKRVGVFLKINKLRDFVDKKSVEYVVKSRYKYEKNRFFSNSIEYDIAVSYMNGYVCELVADYVDAKKKICFYLGSTDNMPHLHKRCLPKFDSIISDSEGTANFLRNNIPEISDRVKVILNYVDYEEVREKAKEECKFILDRNENVMVLCSCGRFSNVKGFDLAVEAAKVLKEQGLPFFWYFVGDGPERVKIDKLIERYGLIDNIHITGIVSNPYPYMSDCDIYVQPSYEESFGLTITEARILHKPVVSTMTVGGQQQITHLLDGVLTGFTGKDIAQGVIQFANNTEFRDKVIHNLEKVDYTQSYKEFCEKWEKLLEK